MRWTTLVLALCTVSAAFASDLQTDLRLRRGRLMEQLGPRTLLVVRSAPERTYSLDIEYEYRQDSNFYYLTGIDQPESILVLMPGNRQRKEILFVLPKDPVREHWTGRRLGLKEATAQSGIETVYSTAQFTRFLETILSGRPYAAAPGLADDGEYRTFLTAVTNGEARLATVAGERPTIDGPVSPAMEFVNKLRDRFPGFTATDATRQIHDLRQVKSAYERSLLERSAEISAEAHLAGMRVAKSGAHEYEVKAAIEQVYRARGALGWGYPSITGSGPNATILHYSKAGRQMDSGDLMLVDAAANFDYYTVDITRTYPVNGKFSPLQKDIYSIVLRAQDEMIKATKAGVWTRDVHRAGVDVIKEGLLKLGLISDKSGDQYKMWYTHGSVHYIGIDVHDVGDYEKPLAPGHAFTMEPGIYVREEVLDSLPKTVENAALIEKIKPAVQKYNGIGVRIEDSFVLTESGLKRLSAKVPRTIEEIEASLAQR
ncbi:MAG: aminopeptidase P N-terminal domain-containing protein [Bryobacteraceae bacterium]